jgi:hypothetical protein
MSSLYSQSEEMSLQSKSEHVRARHVTSEDILSGSFGHEVDKHIGKSPKNAPIGYRFRKIRYTQNEVDQAGSNNVIGVNGGYQMGPTHVGLTSSYQGSAQTSRAINDDQAGGAGIANPNHLQSGDLILGAILIAHDERAEDNRVGNATSGFASVKSFTRNTSSPFKAEAGPDGMFQVLGNGTSASAILEKSSSFATITACAKATKHAVCTYGLQTEYPVIAKGLPGHRIVNDVQFTPANIGDLSCLDTMNPALAIAFEGLDGRGSEIRFELVIYALCAAKGTASEEIIIPDEEFCMSDLSKCLPIKLTCSR